MSLTEMLGDLKDEPLALLSALDLEGVQDGRELVRELHVHDGTDHSDDLSLVHIGRGHGPHRLLLGSTGKQSRESGSQHRCTKLGC